MLTILVMSICTSGYGEGLVLTYSSEPAYAQESMVAGASLTLARPMKVQQHEQRQARPAHVPTVKKLVKAKISVGKKKAALTRASVRRSTAPVVITAYDDKPGSQQSIDKCHLVLWSHSPLWLAGHNWCGYQWMAHLRTGARVVVSEGIARGSYAVTGHVLLSRQSGAMPHVDADLVLQTCVGSGTGLTLLHHT